MKVHIASPEGLDQSEHDAIRIIEDYLPKHWVGYAGILLLDSKRRSLEFDVLIFAEDRILMVELKNWAGEIHMEDKQWIQTTPAGRKIKHVSPIDTKRKHAQRIKSMFSEELSKGWGNVFYEIQAMVVLSGPAIVTQKSPKDKGFVVSLDEFKTIGDPHAYREILPETAAEIFFRKNPSKRPFVPEQIKVFEDWKRGGNKVQLRLRNEAGYVISEKMPHLQGPNGFYNEWDAEHERDSEDKSQVRLWDFNKLTHVGTDMSVRAFYGLREDRTQRHIRKHDSQLGKDYLLEPKHYLQEDTLAVDMAEVYQLPRLAERLDEYLDSFNPRVEDRILLLRALLTPLAGMHSIGVYHRDLSSRRLWWDKERSAIIISGLTCAKFPDKGRKSISDMRQEMATTGIILPEDAYGVTDVLGQAIDVFQIGVLCYLIAYGEKLPLPASAPPEWVEPANDPFEGKLHGFIQKSLEIEANDRYQDAAAMLEHLSLLLNYQNIETNEDKERVLKQLHNYSSNTILLSVYQQLGEIDNDMQRQRMSYKSTTADGVSCSVRIFMNARSNKDNHGQSQRLLHFLERCSVASTNVLPIPKLIEFGCGMMGTHIVQEFVVGENLEQWMETSGRLYEQRYELADAIIRAIHNLHDLELSHGDLKPENILVRELDGKLNILLLDMFDLDLDGLAPSNSEFAPTIDVSTTARDRYAVYLIVDELFGGCMQAGAKKIRDEIRNALGGTNVVPRNLDMLRRTITVANEPEPTYIEPIIIESNGFASPDGEVFEMDSGCYHLSVSKNKDLRLFFYGASHKLTVVIKADGDALTINRIFYDRLGTGEMVIDTRNAKKNGNTSMPVEQTFLLKKGQFGAPNTNLIEFVKTLHVVLHALKIEPEVEELAPTPSDGSVPIKKLWKRLVEVERETLPTVIVIKEPKEIDGAVHVQINENIDAFEFGHNDVINVTTDDHDTRFGQLDVRQSGSGILILTNDGRSNHFRMQNIGVGTILTLSNSGNDVSWNRRDRALDRVLSGDAVMHDLTDRFISGPKGEQPPALPMPTKEQIESYGLDESKHGAFLYLLQNPLSVLMGPPGTGKTTILSAALDYLLNEADVRRILVVSQSHTAADEVANRVREFNTKRTQSEAGFKAPSIVRLGDRSRINKGMLDVHTSALQDQARTAFHRDLEVRMLSLATRLKLPKQFVLDSAALYRSCGRELFEYAPARNDLNEANKTIASSDNPTKKEQTTLLEAQRRLERLTSSLERRMTAYTDMPNQVFTHSKPLHAVLEIIAERNQVNNPKRIERMAEVIKVAHHWYQRLATDEAGYAAFAARTRQLVVGTLVGIGHGGYQLDRSSFDLVVIDEAGRATFSELAIAMQSAKRVLLVGDHKQLAPNYDADHVRKVSRDLSLSVEEVKRTDFERAFNLNDGHMLSKQYRMAPAIGEIISQCFYEGNLQTGRGLAPEWMSKLPAPWNKTVSWIDTSESKAFETNANKDIANEAEVDLLSGLLEQLVADGTAMEYLREWNEKDSTPAIGVITGYRKQVELLQQRLESAPWAAPIRSMLKIDTIDSYQGSENRIIMLSLVRNNTDKNGGFMTDDARVNVALSRAKERLIIVGAGTMWASTNEDTPLSRVYDYISRQQDKSNSEHIIIKSSAISVTNSSENKEVTHA
jgi:serine/threonine protein kinase